jgi:uncharacterized protein YbbC (DUF1343 family)
MANRTINRVKDLVFPLPSFDAINELKFMNGAKTGFFSKMHYFTLNMFIILIFGSFTCANSKKINTSIPDQSTLNQEENAILPAAYLLPTYYPLLKGKRVGLVVNQTSTINQTHLVDSLLQLGINVVTIFAPEHGFRGDHSAGAHIKNDVDGKTGIAITSLYGNNKKPSAEIMKNLDIVVFDIQDVGVRFYTYISTMHYVMEACAENKVPFIVLDRPNPNGHYVDGPVLDLAYKSFVGMHPVPLVHGMTVGEFATMINQEGWLNKGEKCELKIIKCLNYTHQSKYNLPIRPSPNLPTMQSVYLYPSLGLFEGTNVSVGRGTPTPFEILGRPDCKSLSFVFTPVNIPGVADQPKYEKIACYGVNLKTYADSLVLQPSINLQWLKYFYQNNTESQGEYFNAMFNKLAGNNILKEQIKQGLSDEDIRKSWQSDLLKFIPIRNKYLLYP